MLKINRRMTVRNLISWLTANFFAKHVSSSQLSPAVSTPSYTASLSPLSVCVLQIMTYLKPSKDSFSASNHSSTWSSVSPRLSSFQSGLRAVLRLLHLYSSLALWHSLSDQYSRTRTWLWCWLVLRPQPFSMPQLSFLTCQRWWFLRACTTQNTTLNTLTAFLAECSTVALVLAKHQDLSSAPSFTNRWASELCVTSQLAFALRLRSFTCSVLKASNPTARLARNSAKGTISAPWLKKSRYSRKLLQCVTHPGSWDLSFRRNANGLSPAWTSSISKRKERQLKSDHKASSAK